MYFRWRWRKILLKYRNVGHIFRIKINRRNGIKLAQSFFYRSRNYLPNGLLVLKLNLCLGRMDIHINICRIDLKIQEIRDLLS